MKRNETKKKREGSFSVINPHAAGIDVGSSEHWVAVPENSDNQSIRKFGCFTEDLNALASWLAECGITTVAMESTGVYWIPLFQVLETRGFEVKLVNAKHVRSVPGRKTDVLDCQWLQRLHTYGLLSGSFRPDDTICVLRSYWRHRDSLIKYASSHVQHMQKALTQMNVQLHKVISDITGLTGIRIIEAILQGERDARILARLRDPHVKNSEETIAKALEGDYREEHLFVLKQALEMYLFYREKITECDMCVEAYIARLDSRIDPATHPLSTPKKTNKKPRRNEPGFDLRTHLYRISGVDFTKIDGLEVSTVQTILSEVGLNPTRFLSCGQFTSWLGLCPNNRITGGKIKSSKTSRVTNRAANAFRLAAQALSNSQSALGGYYRRMRNRLGPPKAITATAHKLARIFYHLWTFGDVYRDPGAGYYEKQYETRVLANITKRAKQLGYSITLTREAGGAVS